jgi:hypothetical protein
MIYEPPRVEVAAHVQFGEKGNATKLQLEGWSTPEGWFTWSTGAASRICIPYRPGPGTLMLEISLTPMLLQPAIREQRLIVRVNDTELGAQAVAGECTLSYPVPPEILGEQTHLIVTLQHPDAVAPAELGINPDRRTLGFAVREMLLLWVPQEKPYAARRRPPLAARPAGGMEEAVRGCTALSPADLVCHFESLGHNCEFGMMQRMVGADPLGLLRFGGIEAHSLLRGLDHAFEGIEDASRLHVFTSSDDTSEEYAVRDGNYGVQFHTHIHTSEMAEDAVRQKMAVHLGFLRRKFEETLQTGHSIFVLHHRACQTVPQVQPFLNMLRSYGRNSLLFVTPSRDISPGTVEQIKPDLFHGYIDKHMPQHDPADINVPAWLSICANTYRLWRESGGGM